ncbi:transcriptional regulator [Lactobacillus acidophilus]|uniref:GyrI-like domain-containing protein n=1 Tax=Lactobacillus acidophilus TaxID=1579 RepID=UPI0021A50AAF|nr:GyrI-like domain-containing protein [Lactobacillus acidophilus]MCT3602297.1 transcriptional regulator [Lactobacillus acidophilus]MCT3624546.1 transcriptional regulator [Lactobacillus acidophilus]
MTYDFKKEQNQFYKPGKKPELIDVPKMTYIVVRGKGNPNVDDSEYKRTIQLLYGIAYTIKMSKKGTHNIKDYFDFVVPPLEGLWWQDGNNGVDYTHKEKFEFISMIRVPDFVTQDVLDWAIKEASEKKDGDFSKVKLITLEEGKCVQVMYVGAYDDEPATIEKMKEFAEQNGVVPDYSEKRSHHEIYLSDPRRTKVENLKTVIRIPVK